MNRSVKILQFGEGNFLRAFADYIIDTGNEIGVLDTDVVIVNPLPTKLFEGFEKQKCRYNVAVQGVSGGNRIEDERAITCVKDAISPQYEYEKYESIILSEELRFVISNTTEAGITLDLTDDFELFYPNSFPGKVTKLLYKRFKHFNGDVKMGLHFIPVELIEANGDTLKYCVLELAKQWNLGDKFIAWVHNSCTFANTLVDRIVSGYPRNSIEKYDKKLGYRDELLVVTEPFYLWVIDADARLREELPLDKVTDHVIFVSDIRPYRERKVRLLNGSHTTLTPVALLYGKSFVRECMTDPILSRFLEKAVTEEIIPTVTCLPENELYKFYSDVKERFGNPFMDHSLVSISLNTVSKFHTRVLPSIVGYYNKYNQISPLLAFAFAATLEYMVKAESFNDSENVLEFISNHKNDDTKTLISSAKEIFDINVEGFYEKALEYLCEIRENGIVNALEKLI